MKDPVRTYELKHPIQHGSEEITELRFRAAVGRDLDDLPVGQMRFGDLRKLAAKLCGHPPTALDSIHPTDLDDVLLITNELLGGGQATGGTS